MDDFGSFKAPGTGRALRATCVTVRYSPRENRETIHPAAPSLRCDKYRRQRNPGPGRLSGPANGLLSSAPKTLAGTILVADSKGSSALTRKATAVARRDAGNFDRERTLCLSVVHDSARGGVDRVPMLRRAAVVPHQNVAHAPLVVPLFWPVFSPLVPPMNLPLTDHFFL